MIEADVRQEGFAKEALQLASQAKQGKAVHDADEDPSIGDPAGLTQGLQRIIKELKGINHDGQIKFVVLKGEVFGLTLLQRALVPETLFGPAEHIGRGVDATDVKPQLVEEKEVITETAADVQDSFALLRVKEFLDEHLDELLRGPSLRRLGPRAVKLSRTDIENKPHDTVPECRHALVGWGGQGPSGIFQW